MKAAVITFPGSNCDRDMRTTLKSCLGKDPITVWHAGSELPDVDLIALPGGFSYGDYLRSGAMSARSPIMREVIRAAEKGTYVLGVCNGFQILTEAGLLPGTLMRNRDLKFICRTVSLKVANTSNAFTGHYKKDQIVRIPIAHHDGNYFADKATLENLEQNEQIAFQYCEPNGKLSIDANPNGSLHHIAGILNKNKNVLGMMPHPERAADSTTGNTDGKTLFESLIGKLS